jgi:hypothetical protein
VPADAFAVWLARNNSSAADRSAGTAAHSPQSTVRVRM